MVIDTEEKTGGQSNVLKRILYWVVRKVAAISFNILNLVLVGNLPPLGSICIVVEDRGRYLLLQRPEGSLVFPGGFMRWREHPAQTTPREVPGEKGLQVQILPHLSWDSQVSTNFVRI